MAIWKITYFFELIEPGNSTAAGASFGWTESWYTDLVSITNIEQALAFAMNRINYVTPRARFLNTATIIRWVRVNQVGSRNVKVGMIGQVGMGGAGAQVQCAALVLFTSPPVAPDTQSRRRAFLLRGLPASIMVGDVFSLKSTSTMYGALEDFCKFMVLQPPPGGAFSGTPWRLLYADPGQAWTPVTNTAVDVANPYILQATTTLNPPSGSKVNVRRAKNPKGANQTWTTQNVPAGGVLPLGLARRPMDSGTWPQIGAQIRQYVPLVRPPANYLIVGLRTKRTGRPFRQPVGRRRR